MIGSSLSHYAITAKLGQGGMGEVYRATDENLGRDVAIKVLPAEVAGDAERLGRFKREAQLLGSLNHTNIASLYGLEEADGKPFLVLELVEGEELSERLQRGVIPVDEAIDIAKQIAEALEEAHDRGIVHRDLKPANVKITPDGRVKVLDFGLAKAYAGDAAEGSTPNVSQSPTMSAQATQAGVILGTAAYMSPEQARGKPVDKRADIWAYGVVIYEMLTGKKLFDGETVSDVLAAVLTREPDWGSLPTATPPAVVRALRRCLDRDPRQRLHDIADARLELGDDSPGDEAASAAPQGGPSRVAALALAAVTAGLASGLTGWLSHTPREAEEPTTPLRFEVPLPEGSQLVGGISLAPDGESLAFVTRDDEGQSAVWVRAMGELHARRVDSSEGGRFPFWSPDGRKLGFFAGGELRVMDLIGQVPRALVNTGAQADVRGATWNRDGIIVYAPTFTGGLFQVPAAGGEPQPATTLNVDENEGTHRFPLFLPDGRHFLFFIATGTGSEPGWIGLGELGSNEHRRLAQANSRAEFLPPSSLLYTTGRMLVAHHLDLERERLVGEPVPLDVEMPGNLAMSGNRALAAAKGTVAYQVGVQGATRIVWADRSGTELGTVLDGRGWLFNPSLAPDGVRISVSSYAGSGVGGIWIVDPARNNQTRMTFEERDDQLAMWSPDGRELAVSSVNADDAAIYLLDASKPRSERRFKEVPGLYEIGGWLTSGDLILTLMDPTNRSDVWILDANEEELRPLVVGPANEHGATASPCGDWLAYASDASGRDEVYVRRFAGGDQVWRVSTDGGRSPIWRRDGKELFYVDLASRMMAVKTHLGAEFSSEEPTFLFQSNIDESGGRQYDVSADGQRFLLNQSAATATNPIVVVRDWGPEIEKKLEGVQ